MPPSAKISSDMTKKLPVSTYAGQNSARFMRIIKEQGVTVTMQHMKG